MRLGNEEGEGRSGNPETRSDSILGADDTASEAVPMTKVKMARKIPRHFYGLLFCKKEFSYSFNV
jgi:hypothetical protein